MRRIIITCLMACAIVPLSAQSFLSFGVRGGLDLLMPQSEQKTQSTPGYMGALDIGYAYYWPVRESALGLHTGVSLGYAASGMELKCTQQFTNYDYLDNEMRYTTSGTFRSSLKRMCVEVPLMLALRHKGFLLQVGPKFQYTIQSNTTQDLTSPMIDAYYVAYDVHVANELITGVVPQEDLHKEYIGGAPSLNVLLSARIGYEVCVGAEGRIGITAFMDYNVWNNQPKMASNIPLINVTPISNPANPIPAVTVGNALESAVSRINPLQVGLSLYFGLDFPKKD